ncbi:MAG: phosphoribosylanthranilate isomerase, partial [Betaproteobacteria bacterium]
FDSYSPLFGGSGHGFDHSLLSPLRHQVGARPIVLSGGLNATNVGSAVVSTEPWAVDVSSGVEISPGVKSAEKMRDFVAAVNRARAT